MVKTFCAAFRALCLALLLLRKGKALARFSGVVEIQSLGDALCAPKVRFLAPADPAAGLAPPYKRALDAALLRVGQRVVIRLGKVQLQLAGLPVMNKIAVGRFVLRGNRGRETLRELIRCHGDHVFAAVKIHA